MNALCVTAGALFLIAPALEVSAVTCTYQVFGISRFSDGGEAESLEWNSFLSGFFLARVGIHNFFINVFWLKHFILSIKCKQA